MKNKLRNTDKSTGVKSLNLLIIALSFHIFAVQSKLLYHLNPDGGDRDPFSFLRIDEQTVTALLFAVAYSLATVTVLSKSKKPKLIWFFAALDSLGMLLYYFTQIPMYFRAVYFAMYTGTLIISTLYLDQPEYLLDQIIEMKEKGVSQREIAQQLDISESKVSRILKRVNDQNCGKVKMNGSLN